MRCTGSLTIEGWPFPWTAILFFRRDRGEKLWFALVVQSDNRKENDYEKHQKNHRRDHGTAGTAAGAVRLRHGTGCDAIIDLYTEEHPEVTIVPTYDSSGTLKTQIQEGAECDLFISAAQKQMNQLDAAKTEEQGNEEGLDFVLSDTRVDLLENKVVLAVPDDNPADIQSFEDLATDKLTLLCIGNEDVPVGAYSEEILTALEILEPLKAANKITYGTNVKEVTTQVKEGTVDAGIIYATDAYSAELTVVDDSGSEYCSPVIYPAAVMKGTANEEAARAFLKYLQSEAAMKIFKEVGFTAP